MDLHKLLKKACDNNASDIHLVAGEPPTFRVYGEIVRQEGEILPDYIVHELIISTMTRDQMLQFNQEKELDYAIDIEEVARFRVNAFENTRGCGAVFRLVPDQVIPFQELDLPDQLKSLVDLTKGLILVTGPTGSGKSTTLAAILDLINKEKRSHIITIEDPIEFVHESKKSLIHHREIGAHTGSFSQALKAALREDPDIILVGELRDLETISLALTAAETGVVVFGTLHTNGAAKTANRIIDVFPAEQQGQIRSMFADSISAIISQTLIKRSDQEGRVAALEILFSTSGIRNMIRENNIHQINSALETGGKQGMQSLDNHLKSLYKQQIISQETALKYCSDAKNFNT